MSARRNYKDSLFRRVFRGKEDLLSLYNALNGTCYTNPGDITVNTLEDVVCIGMKNDISFILDGRLSLYEHQSTKNANMPLRDLFYVSELFRGIAGDEDIYKKKTIELPAPRFVVFYNGTEELQDDMELRLSDAFAVHEERPSLELIVRVINVNEGRNHELMSACSRLDEYSTFVALVRMYKKEKSSLEEAMDAAIEEALRRGILTDILTKERTQVVDWLHAEYNEELHMKVVREEAFEDGFDEGIGKGISQGRLDVVMESVEEGDFSLEKGAEKAGISIEELAEKMRAAGKKVPEAVVS